MQEAAAGQNRKFSELARVIQVGTAWILLFCIIWNGNVGQWVTLKNFQEQGGRLKDVCTVHHKLMADVAVLLRTIARMENFHFPAIPKFLARFSR